MTYLFRMSCVVALLGVASCSMAIEVKIANFSREKLVDLEAHAGQIVATINQVGISQEKIIAITPTGDSSLELKFRTESGTAKVCALDVYLTRGLHGQIDVAINEDFSCELRLVETSVR